MLQYPIVKLSYGGHCPPYNVALVLKTDEEVQALLETVRSALSETFNLLEARL